MQCSEINPKYRLTTAFNGLQNPSVAPQWVTGIRTPCNRTATTDAPRVFFYVATNATEHQVMVWCVHSGYSIAGHEQVSHHSTMSMVAQAGQLSGWPVLVLTGSANPVWAIAIMKIRTFGDSIICYRTEVAIMTTTPTNSRLQSVYFFDAFRRVDLAAGVVRLSVVADSLREARQQIKQDFTAAAYRGQELLRPAKSHSPRKQFTWVFLAVSRSDSSARACRKEVTASDFSSARRALSQDFITFFAGRLPFREVSHE